ncbi:MAG: hypothetical protein AAGG56_02180 [Pseudomonadota bacterium]
MALLLAGLLSAFWGDAALADDCLGLGATSESCVAGGPEVSEADFEFSIEPRQSSEILAANAIADSVVSDAEGTPIVVVKNGGNGGSGHNECCENGKGGSGGGSVSSTSVAGTATITTTANSTPAVTILETAGNGGHGGYSDCCKGGSGGSGGSVEAVTVTAEQTPAWTLSTTGESAAVALELRGGSGNYAGASATAVGNSGGTGGSVSEANLLLGTQTSTTITTTNANSPGLYIFTLGGNGGTGGQSDCCNGGGGGNGGGAGSVYIYGETANTISVTTSGDTSPGIEATLGGGTGGAGGQGSVAGGGGGQGGSAGQVNLIGYQSDVAAKVDIQTSGSKSPAISLQSTGGDGGRGHGGGTGNGGSAGNSAAGGTVAVIVEESTLTTQQEDSPAVVLVSQGGDGGSGGSSSLAEGKNGGIGRGGGAVRFTASGTNTITTAADESDAIELYSLGGIGGEAGNGGWFGPGGNGGATGNSGTVTVDLSGAAGSTIKTEGDNSFAIKTQSVAGHGGSAGANVGLVTFGASGGSAGAGGEINITNAAALTTTGNTSVGISAMSSGGGGGQGGDAFGVFFSNSGSGGQGGAGGTVSVGNTGTIHTSGNSSQAIFAQSIGGTGGAGGSSGALVAIGGRAADGSNGGPVTLTNSGEIKTGTGTYPGDADGDDGCVTGCSNGILAQSIGGGGGAGGAAGGLFAFGGTGSSSAGGGNGNTVEVLHSSALVSTTLDNSPAILAQSIGGGGGHGGAAVSVSPVGLGAAVGGPGGRGGSGGAVTLGFYDAATVETSGDASYGIAAQSVGGSGGGGGFAVSTSVGADIPAMSVSIGGGGGGGGSASKITVDTIGTGEDSTPGTITTGGDNATGLLAQSVGGGGGHGGTSVSISGSEMPSLSVAVGGSAGGGGNGGYVEVTSDAGIATSGDHADALLAQSVGGGGGHGGTSVAASISTTAALGVSVGGSGGSGGSAGSTANNGLATKVTSSGTEAITTDGDYSHGVLAQAIGGGGGKGGTAISGSITMGDSASLDLGFGGTGGTGGEAYGVDVDVSNPVTTTGDHSPGISGQSIAGGGGAGGIAIAANVSLASEDGSAEVAFALGGKGGAGADATSTTVTNSGDVTTSGDHSPGVVSQAIAGGGGTGGLAITGTVSMDESASLDLAFGGVGGTGGTAQGATVTVNGPVSTSGQYSDAVVAQSIGGGGGNGGAALSGAVTGEESTSVTIAVGGGCLSGNSNCMSGGASTETVTATILASVSATGDGSRGVVAQSIGGGGGSGGASFTGAVGSSESTDIDLSIGGKGSGGGAGGAVLVTTAAAVSTGSSDDVEASLTGEHAILAQSIGGGGGAGGLAANGEVNGGNSGNRSVQVSVGGFGGSGAKSSSVTVTAQAAISTLGYLSHGILAQSIAGGGGDGGATTTWGETTESSKPYSVAVGGFGGGGASSGVVTVTNQSSITVSGPGSRGIVAQSIAGGGGTGGSNLFKSGDGSTDPDQYSIGVGGFGGTGATAKGVTLYANTNSAITTGTTDGSASTYSADAANYTGHGLLAQSVGGGGGDGGSGIEGDVKPGASSDDDSTKSADIAVGGFGGGGGGAGSVTIGTADSPFLGSITTWDANANGMLAQSIGGGGGSGGTAISGDVKNSSSEGLTVGVGGFGAGAGGGGAVSIITGATVTTQGDNAKGIHAQSIGGAGGTGGVGIKGDISGASDDDTTQIDVGLGGRGAGGGNGNWITLTNTGNVTTGVNGSGTSTVSGMDALAAQSIGGGGGASGVGIEGNISNSTKSKATTLTLGLALNAGGAGDGNTVTVSNSGILSATGNGARGILAQSIGGAGGAGGIGIEGDISAPSDASSDTQLDVGVGGKGGKGGDGSTVKVTNTNTIMTGYASNGSNSDQQGMHGVMAQSIGSGGGAGGIAVKGDVTGSENSDTFTLAVGGAGGSGGAGGDVTVNNTGGTITTRGDGSKGIYAQSVGGGGGDASGLLNGSVSSGGGTALTAAIGATGGTGGDGGTVGVTNSGSITTGSRLNSNVPTINQGHGIFAQSIGAGGGNGKFSGGLLFGSTQNAGFERGVSMSLGGAASGGSGEAVTVTNAEGGSIITWNRHSHGVLAQSIGGGGGHASDLGGLGTSNPSDRWLADINVGGGTQSEGKSADGGTVTLTNDGTITTHGAGAVGLYAQSIGGGGGAAGNGAGAKEKARNVAQSTFNAVLAVNVGGQAVSSGDGKTVTIEGSGSITTNGEGAVGIQAQSIGGGGGRAASAAAGLSSDSDADVLDGRSGIVTIGGTGGTKGNGGDVTISDYSGNISTGTSKTGLANAATSVVQAHGIFAQSVGGGGGDSGTVLMGPTSNFGSGLDMSLNSDKDTSGTGGDVSVTASGKIATQGNSSVGIFAQSVGGGGGVKGEVGRNLTGALIGSGGGTGAAGTVEVTYSGTRGLSTSGAAAHGIFAQSAGGSGTSTVTTPVVTVETSGNVSASGGGAHGIFAQSTGAGMGPIQITVDAGATVTGGTTSRVTDAEDGVGVFVKDGTDNTITNKGTIRSTTGKLGIAVAAVGSGTTTLNNTGTIRGEICGPTSEGSCSFTATGAGESLSASALAAAASSDQDGVLRVRNRPGGVIESGSTLQAAEFRNAGTFAPSGIGSFGDTEIVGAFEQTGQGALLVDVGVSGGSAEPRNDTVYIEGAALLDGTLVPQYHLGARGAEPEIGAQEVDVIAASDGLTLASGFAVQPSAVAGYETSATETGLALSYDIEFASDAILAAANDNQSETSRHLAALYEAAALSGEAAPTAEALVGIETVGGYLDAVDSLGPELYGATQAAAQRTIRRFGDGLMSCANRAETADLDGYRLTAEGQCFWYAAGGARLDQEASGDALGFTQDSFDIGAGAEYRLNEIWHVGVAGGYTSSSLDMDGDASADGDYYQLGAVVKRDQGALQFAAALSAGLGSYDTERVTFAGERSTGDQDLWNVSTRLRASYAHERPTWYARPRIDLGIDYVSAGSVTESGAAGTDLRVSSSDETYVSLAPAIEMGGEWQGPSDLTMRPSLTLGLTQYLGNPGPGSTAKLEVASSSTPSFQTDTEFDNTYLDLAAGLDLLVGTQTTVKFDAFGSFSEHTTSGGGAIRIEVTF